MGSDENHYGFYWVEVSLVEGVHFCFLEKLKAFGGTLVCKILGTNG